MADAVESWCMNLARNGKMGRTIVLAGPYGCAKTHCWRAAKKYVRDVRMSLWPEPRPWAHPPNFYACNWAEFVREVGEFHNEEMREDLLSADIVFADDVGSEEDRFKSGQANRILGDILGALHDKNKYVFLTMNVDATGWRDRWDGRVEDRLLRMNAEIVDLTDCESFATWKLRNL